jgi:hypothetical protein
MAVFVVGVLASCSASSSDSGKTVTGPVSSHLVVGGDLGRLDSEQALRSKIEPALSGDVASPTSAAHSALSLNRCEGVARKLQPQGAALAYVATARWQATEAEVFGFSPPGAPATSSRGHPTPTRVYVLARADCRLLVFQSFAP